MNLFPIFTAVVFLISSAGCISQASVSRIEIVTPTIEQETTSIWRTINDIDFLEDQGYSIRLPKNPLIDSLILKSKNGNFGNEDFPTIYSLVEAHVFDPDKYLHAVEKVENQIELINNLIYKIDSKRNKWDWDFKMFEKYQVVFTLYGTGGSYDPDTGIITMLTNTEGEFMNYKNPANTLIHEIAHIGMEYSIVRKYAISHGLKERIVDTFVALMFQEQLPEYNIQNMGDKKIDKYLKEQKDINSLNSIVSKFLK